MRQKGYEGREGREGALLLMLALVLPVPFSLFPLPSFAFDSEGWLGKRELMTREAERLQAVYRTCAGKVTAPAENVTIPVETHADGSVKTVVQAAKAQYFMREGLVWGEGVVVRRLKPDGTDEACIKAKNCVVDRASRSGWAEGPAVVTQGKSVFRGTGVYFSSGDAYVKVFADSEMESADLREEGKAARITSWTADLDRPEGVAMFEGGVVVRYAGEYTMCADRLFAFLVGSNELSRVVALDSVSITNGMRVGTCAMATYRRRKNEIEMFGKGTNTVARLVDGEKESTALEGSRIRFWLDTERVEVKDTRIVSERKGAEGLL